MRIHTHNEDTVRSELNSRYLVSQEHYIKPRKPGWFRREAEQSEMKDSSCPRRELEKRDSCGLKKAGEHHSEAPELSRSTVTRTE